MSYYKKHERLINDIISPFDVETEQRAIITATVETTPELAAARDQFLDEFKARRGKGMGAVSTSEMIYALGRFLNGKKGLYRLQGRQIKREPIDPERWYATTEVADLLGLGIDRVRQLMHAGQLADARRITHGPRRGLWVQGWAIQEAIADRRGADHDQ